MTIEYLLLIGSSLILASIALAKFSDNLGVPTLLLFIAVGMLAGSEGPGRIYFDDPRLAQSVGIVALVFILFAAGFDTRWASVRPVVKEAVSLATAGVLLTALLVGVIAFYVLRFTWLESLLLGAVISSTDSAAVFSVLRSRNVSLKGNLQPLLELESGSNDPMAVFLTIGLIQFILYPQKTFADLVLLFIFQMGLGLVMGLVLGKAVVGLLNRLKSSYEGIYPVFALALVSFIYGATSVLKGSGFLAVYVAGIIVGNNEMVHKRSLLRFFDGLAWLSQIAMFITLGLLVFPSRLLPVLSQGLLISGFLMLVARPLGVFISTAFSPFNWREKTFISWVGLRGAVPIILATFPMLAKLPNSELIFNLVFFIVLSSALLQGWSIPLVAGALGVDAPVEPQKRHPIEFAPAQNSETDLLEFIVPYGSDVAGKSIVEIGMPKDSLIVLVIRDERFIVPSGGTLIEEGDVIQALGNKKGFQQIQSLLSKQKEKEEDAPKAKN